MTTKPTLTPAVFVWVLIAICLLVMLVAIRSASAGHLNPGCENQELRPRLVGCCPRFKSGETLPPQCVRWEASGHLAECCGAEPDPTPTPEECLWLGTCPSPSSTTTGICAAPTPLPTPVTHQKGSCCTEVRKIYATVHRDIVRREQAELKALIRWRKEEMRECREGY